MVWVGQRRDARGWPARLRIRVQAVAALALCGLLATACDRGSHPGRVGSTAPEFTVSDGARLVDLAKLRGHVVVLNFWATYCIPCIEEVPSLHRLLERFLHDFLDYSCDEVHDEAERLEHFISERLEDRIAAKLGDPL